MAPAAIMLAVSVAMTVASAATSAIAAAQRGRQEQRAQEAQGQLAMQEAAVREEAIREKNRRAIAAQEAGYAASGVTFEGSPMEVMAESARTSELDALRARWGGESEYALRRYYGQQAREAARWQIGATLLTGMSQAASQYGNYSYMQKLSKVGTTGG